MKDSFTQANTEDLHKTNPIMQIEKHQIPGGINNTQIDCLIDNTVIDLFEKKVEESPEAVAIFEERQLTYNELNERSNQLAHYLRSKGVRKETLIPICIERSPQMIIGILGILKAGGAYVPIDTDYPEERIRYILQDTGATIAISSKESKIKLECIESLHIIELDTALSLIYQQPKTNLQIPLKTFNLVYVIYTSGSTGKPKGVMIEHGGLTNLSLSQVDGFRLKPGMRTLQFASFGFDASCSEIFTALLSGGCLVLPQKKDLLSAEEFEKLINKHKVEVVTLPPSYQHVIKNSLGTLKTIISAGEPLNEVLGKYLQSKGIRLINAYGPTENTVCVSMSDDPIKDNHVTVIGKPISNVQVYILDKQGNLCPVGITGEICVAGVQVARGYLNRPELTAEKFIENPFGQGKGERMYKTGDLGRWLADGDIEFFGRIDDQVKIRGYRIELGEIESVLNQCELVKQAVVLAKGDTDGEKVLVAYIAPKKLFDKKAITAYLKSKLPDYMVPAILVETERFSVTPNGKIDKKALPDPNVDYSLHNKYAAPRTEVEKELAKIWKELFQMEQIGIHDNFFELGGDSLKAVLVVSHAKRANYDLKPSDFFTCETIEELSNVITARINSNGSLKQNHINGEKKWIIPKQNEGAKIPFFFMSPGFSVYDQVIAALDKEQPFYYFIPYSYKRVEDLASNYIREMKKIQPHGPYCLGGYCDNAEVALEMAQQLGAEGEKVNFLALFEFYPPTVFKPFDLKERVKYYYNELKKLSIKKKALFFSELVSFQFRKLRKRASKVIDTKFRDLRDNSEYLKDKDGYLIGKGLYSAKPYHGKVLLFKSSIKTLRTHDDPCMGWSDYFKNAEVFTIEGDHLTMFYKPGGIQIAEKLNAYAVLKE